jgi:large subunit ribosomal protein L17
MAYIELLGAEKELNEKAEKRAEARQRRREEMQKQLDEHSAVNDGSDPSAQP